MHVLDTRLVGWLLTGVLAMAVLGWVHAPASAQALTRLYLSASKAAVIDLKDPATKVAVANPAIADVQVITPTQLLVIGRGVGVTSLIVFFPRYILQYDLVVHGAPVGAVGAEVLTGAPYAVLVQRGDRITEHFFSRDTRDRWLELGSVKIEAEAAPK
jgi:Flp pilus assembly secretin CpaC